MNDGSDFSKGRCAKVKGSFCGEKRADLNTMFLVNLRSPNWGNPTLLKL